MFELVCLYRLSYEARVKHSLFCTQLTIPLQKMIRPLCKAFSSSSAATMYQLIGGELSPYTGKVRMYLIHKKIQHERVVASMDMYMNFIKPKVGWSIIPVLVTPEKHIVQDSTDITEYLERRHPTPSIIPTTPKQRVLAKLFDMLACEWLVQPVMHYRWSFPENETFLKLEFGRTLLPRENQKTQSETSEMFYGKFKGMLPVLGITEKSGPEIEKSWKGLIKELSEHFDKHPYLLGGRPCIGDFAFAGMMYAHLYRDPASGFLLKTTAPAVAAWCEMMNGTLPEFNQNNIHVLEDGFPVRQTCDPSATDYCANDEIPETLLPILKRMMTEFAPVLLSTKNHLTDYIKGNMSASNTKLPRLIGTHQYKIGEVTEARSINPFNVWMWQHVTDTYQSLSAKEKESVNSWMKQIPFGPEIVNADLNPCRVHRVKNFLHVDPIAFSSISKL